MNIPVSTLKPVNGDSIVSSRLPLIFNVQKEMKGGPHFRLQENWELHSLFLGSCLFCPCIQTCDFIIFIVTNLVLLKERNVRRAAASATLQPVATLDSDAPPTLILREYPGC